MRTLAVVTAVADRWESAIVAGLTRASGIEVVRRCVDLPDLLAVAASGVAHVAIVSGGLRGLDLSAVSDLRSGAVAVVAVVDPGDEDAERRVRQLGVLHVVTADAVAAELADAVRAAADAAAHDHAPPPGALPHGALGQPGPGGTETYRGQAGPGMAARDADDPDAEVHEGVVVAVWGASGAPGRSTVAVNLAAELAEAGHEVLLVDADTHAAGVAAMLGLLDEVAGVATACRFAEQGALDVAALARVAPVVEPRLRVLTGLPRADRWTEVRQAALSRVLEVARLLSDVVVVDCASSLEDDEELSYDTLAPRRNMATLTVVDEADVVLAVGAGDPLGLQRLVRAVDDLRTRGGEPDRLVVTKVRKAAMGPGAGRHSLEVLERYVGAVPTTLLPWSPEVLDAAVLAGRTLTATAPSAPLRAGLRALAADLAPVPARKGPDAEEGRGLAGTRWGRRR